MSVQEIIDELKSLGNDATEKNAREARRSREPFFGVKVEDLKKIQKRIKKDYKLALELYDTGISDAMYLAGLIADDAKMTTKDLQRWAKEAYWSMLSEYTVPWVAAESHHGHELALEWIESPRENIAAAGWATLSSLVAIKADVRARSARAEALLDRVSKTIHHQPGRVPNAMNGFVIAVGTYVSALTGIRDRNGTQDGQGLGQHGRDFVQGSSALDSIHKAQQRFGRQEAEDSEMLIKLPTVGNINRPCTTIDGADEVEVDERRGVRNDDIYGLASRSEAISALNSSSGSSSSTPCRLSSPSVS